MIIHPKQQIYIGRDVGVIYLRLKEVRLRFFLGIADLFLFGIQYT